MESPTADVIEVLRKAIAALHFTQKEVEHRLGLSQGYLSRLFGGQIELKTDHVAQIAQVLNVDPGEIFRLAFREPKGKPTKHTLRLREALGAPAAEGPSSQLSQIEEEIERIVQRALALSRDS